MIFPVWDDIEMKLSPTEWTQERIEALFLKVEESQRLDYKDGRFLKKDCQDALTKQITGFANSDGGTLIIGVAEGQGEQKHLATGFAPCDGVEWSKERLEAQ
ncbi:helix-turn-helix domain-containing protein [Deinococcus fonticola]|uniref:AlbA family DNA-binding domain-containing protein n=1 Tax=Deinococcus fonticola TaxID=2528713 RepID=UPI00107583BB|nr:ATP-binding protein [Deinococcus fonticola]